MTNNILILLGCACVLLAVAVPWWNRANLARFVPESPKHVLVKAVAAMIVSRLGFIAAVALFGRAFMDALSVTNNLLWIGLGVVSIVCGLTIGSLLCDYIAVRYARQHDIPWE